MEVAFRAGAFGFLKRPFNHVLDLTDELANEFPENVVGLGELDEPELPSQHFLLGLRHPVVLFIQNVLHIDILVRNRFSPPRYSSQHFSPQKEVGSFQQAGVEEIGQLNNEVKEGTHFDGHFPAEGGASSFGIEPHQLAEGFCAVLHF